MGDAVTGDDALDSVALRDREVGARAGRVGIGRGVIRREGSVVSTGGATVAVFVRSPVAEGLVSATTV